MRPTSGVTVTLSCVTSTSITAASSPAPGPASGSPSSTGPAGCDSSSVTVDVAPGVSSSEETVSSARTARFCALTPAPLSVRPAEFHIRADGDRNTTWPLPSRASMLPAAPSRTRSPSAFIEYSSDARAGFFAAASVSTSRTWRKPSTVAVRIRFVSGKTSSYTARVPSSRGSGKLPGQPRVTDCPSSPMVTSDLPSPPSENDISTTAALGPSDPSARLTNVASGSVQPPSCFATLIGEIDLRSVKVLPSGLANTVSRSVRSATTSTCSPDFSASTSACCPSVSGAEPSA